MFLVALGIDYNIFLMTRVREEAAAARSRDRGALIGLAATGGVITSAGLVLAGTFAALGDAAARVPGRAGLRRGVRRPAGHDHRPSVLVTALNLDIGKAIWWPSALSRQPDPAPQEEPVAVPVA